uniref:Uncharacterized protein n=1 Tax=Astyanax mexicanus TaxID=7994 RepID=A0A8B9LHX0_ASTMX
CFWITLLFLNLNAQKLLSLNYVIWFAYSTPFTLVLNLVRCQDPKISALRTDLHPLGILISVSS